MTEKIGKIYKIQEPGTVAGYISRKIEERLKKGDVLWLLAGGSSVEVEVLAADLLKSADGLDRLTVSLIDERYGPPGHADSNWQKLLDSGFRLDGSKQHPILSGLTLEETVEDYSRFLGARLDGHIFALGIPGMGADGHTAGILPQSPAIETKNFAAGYTAADFKRITITPAGMMKLSKIVLYAVGESKRTALTGLLEKDLPIGEQPVQIIKKVPNWTVFNDLIGEEI